jgi:hypothetical protein
VGTTATFVVTALGTSPLSYQWSKDGTNLSSATSSSLVIDDVQASHAGKYSVQVTNVAGKVQSREATLLVLSSPRICPVTDQVATVGRLLAITNCTENMVPPITFRLDPAAPAGASLTADGVFRWRPQCEQGGTTNLISISAVDSGTKPVSNSMAFSVAVYECMETRLGNTAVLTGHSNSVSVRLLSAIALTNMSFRVVYPPERLTNFAMTLDSSQVITQEVSYLEAGQVQVSFTLPAGSPLHGPKAAGELWFAVLPGQSSSFVQLAIRDVTGLTLDGHIAANDSGLPGRVVVIGPEPLLEAWREPNRGRILRLYGNPGQGHVLEWKSNLFDPAWQTTPSISLTNLSQDFEVSPEAQSLFYRALKQ